MNKNRKLTAFFVIGLIIAGIFIKCYYIGYTETWQRQHDVISFGADEGHAAYIEYIMQNKKLPDFDPRQKWGFFQPPLHHIVSALVISVSEALGANVKRAQENTQIATCVYMMLTMFISVYIFLKAKGTKKVMAKSTSEKLYTAGCISMLGIIAVHPMFTLLSGSINNDALALFLSVVALITAAYWDEKPTYFRTVLLAIIIGLAMFAKLTGGLVAVTIGILMFNKFFGFSGTRLDGYGKKASIAERWRLFTSKYFVKAVVFAVIVFPLGLGFGIRNKIKWDVPLNYIPPVGEVFPDAITLRNRITDIFTDSVYTKMVQRGDGFDEYNVPLAMIKTSLFGEYSYADVSRWMRPLTLIVFISALMLIVLAVVATVYMLFSKKSKMNGRWKLLLGGTYFVYLVAYLYFALSSDNFSAQDFRYSAICILCEGIFVGLFADTINNKFIRNAISVLAVVFAAGSFLTYALLGFKS